MLYFVLTLGAVIAGVGIFGLARPARITGMIARVKFTEPLRYLAAALRLAVGVVLYLVAEDTDFPLTMRILAGFSLLSGVVVLFPGRETLQGWLDSCVRWPAGAVRWICGAALALGVFLIVAAVPVLG